MGAASPEQSGGYLIVARVRRPHGVRGELLVSVDTDRPKQVLRVGRSFHLGDRDARPIGQEVALEAMKLVNDGAIIRLREVASRESADQYRGLSLLIAQSEALPAGEDEIHHRDLVGSTAVAGGSRLGTVEDIVEMGGSELLLIRGAARKEILVPLVRDLVESFDPESREIRLRLPDGFLEL